MRTVLAFLLVMLCVSPAAASARGDVSRGNRLYEKGDYAQALTNYKEALQRSPESDIINFNTGTALYKTGEFDQSIEHLQKALLSDDDALKEKAQYNLGNAFYRAGMTRAGQSPDLAVKALEKSLGHYERAMEMDKKDEDARFNYDIVKKRLEELKKKQQQKQQQKQNQDQKNQQDQNQQKQSSQPRDQEDQKKNGSQQQQQQSQSQEQEKEQQQQGQQNEEQPQADQQEDQRGQGEQEQQRQSSQNQQPGTENQKEMTKKEAEMLLNDYQQNEEPQGLLNFMKHKAEVAPVKRNW